MTSVLERVAQLYADLREAIRLSVQYLRAAVTRHVEEALRSVLISLLQMAVGAALLLAITTAIGAAVGALAGGAGAAPGAAVGFEVGMALLEWLGLVFLVKWVADSVTRIGSAFATFFHSVWDARGDSKKIDQAARELAEAIGVLLGVAVEALVMWAVSLGAEAELRLAEDLLAGKTPVGAVRNVEGLAESSLPGERVPEYRVKTSAGTRLVESKAVGEPGKPFSKNTIRNNVGSANEQIRVESGRTGETNGLIRLDAREAGNTEVTPEELADWVSSKLPSPRESLVTRWVEIFYKNARGETLRVVLELEAKRFTLRSTQVMK